MDETYINGDDKKVLKENEDDQNKNMNKINGSNKNNNNVNELNLDSKKNENINSDSNKDNLNSDLNDNNNNNLNVSKGVEIKYSNTFDNMNINDILDEFIKEIRDLKKFLEPEILKENIHDSARNQKFFILCLWLIWLINVSLFTTGDLSLLFFSGIGIFTSILALLLCTLIVIVETLNIINKQYKFFVYEYIIFSLYFWMLVVILFKSLINSKGWGWQFYVIFILININLIIIPKFNIPEFNMDKIKKN